MRACDGVATGSLTAPPPAVSVLVPTYNRAPFIAAAVESVLAQTFEDFELIVVDDGSTDETRENLERFHDPRLRVCHLEHRGVRAALNAGVRAARGRYIARNDSDDLWLPDLLSITVPALEADPAIGLVYARAEFIDAHGASVPGSRGSALAFPDDPLRSLLHTDYTSSVTSVMRRTAIERAGFWDESLGTSEDWEMALRIALHSHVSFIDRVVAHIRLHAGNSIAAHAYATRALPDRLHIVESVLRDPAAPPRLAALAPRFRRNVHIGTALQYVDRGQFTDALRSFAHAVAVGGNPLRTCARIAWCSFSWMVIARHSWSRDLAQRLATRWRTASNRVPPARTAPGRVA